MTRTLLALAVLAACKKKPPPPPVVVDEPAIADAAIDAAMPAIASTPLTGNLAGKPFTVKKAMLSTRPDGASLALYAWRDGDPCAVQFAPEPDQLYVEVAFKRAAAGVIENPRAIYKKPSFDPIKETVAVVIDSLGDTAKGRLLLTAPDGTRVEGAFEATVCAGAQKELPAPAPIHGLAWGTRDVEPTKLPTAPVSGILLGTAGAPVAVEVIDWKDVAEQHEVHFYFTPPKQPCQFDQLTPGFKIGFGKTLARGLAVNTESTIVTRGASPWAAAIWTERGNSIGLEGNGWVSAIIDKHTPETIEGRVFAWFSDPSKSMIAGAFTAKNCNAKP